MVKWCVYSLRKNITYNIIECLAHKIVTSITNEFKVVDHKVVIRKPDAAINVILLTVEVKVHAIV